MINDDFFGKQMEIRGFNSFIVFLETKQQIQSCQK